MFRSTTLAFFAATIITVVIADEPRTLCFDYSDVLPIELDPKDCKVSFFNRTFKNFFKQKKKEFPDVKCKQGAKNEKMAFTGTTTVEAAEQVLLNLCADALATAARGATTEDWTTIQNSGVDLEEFYRGIGFLNLETGNFKQDEKSFLDREGYERWISISKDPRLDDHYPTTEESYRAGQAVKAFFDEESKTKLISAPTDGFEAGCASNTAMCCWGRDRQYFDNNGGCQPCDCANEDPGDNTDLCWTEDSNGDVFPYPSDTTEGDLHCHGISWGDDDSDINTSAKWNSLFYVSMYDHMYERGYVGSITNDPNIAGLQPMCGCIEDMAPVARADCNQVVGETRYTVSVDADQKLRVEPIADTFELKFEECEGYKYLEDFTPEDYANPRERKELKNSNNDLAAFVFKQYLEGKIDATHVEAVEETLIGYRNPDVNKSDKEREEACKAAFKERFPDLKYKERKLTDVDGKNIFSRNQAAKQSTSQPANS